MVRGKLVLSLVALVVVLVFLRGCAFRPQSNNPGSTYNQGANAIWLSVDWVNQSHPAEEITALASNLAAQQIRYAFVYVSYMQPATRDFNQAFTYAANFVKNFHLAQPGIKVLAWIGVPLSYGITFSDSDVRSRIVAFSKQMIDGEGFDGVHLDAEPVSSGDQDFLTLLADIRQAISPAMLSIATEKIQPIFPNLALTGGRFIGWSADYYRQIAQNVDQIGVMAYDTAMPLGWLYREFMRFEVIG